MANERDRRRAMMQQALDDAESPDALASLDAELDDDPDERAHFDRLRRTDTLLRAAPMESAPEHLALRIVAALAQRLSPERMRESSTALAIGLAALALLLTPLLAAVGWLVISSLSSASALGGLFGQITLLIGALVGALERIADSAQDLMAASPEAAIVLLGLVPIAVMWLVRFRWKAEWDDDDDAG